MKALNHAIAVLALIPVLASAQEPTGPSALATLMMTQFYDVNADQVSVTLSERTALHATARAEAAGGHVCNMDMVPAPTGVTASTGWLVGAISCDQRK